MEKKRYYVIPETLEIMDHPDNRALSYEIMASESEVDRLQDVLSEMDREDFEQFTNAHFWLAEETRRDNMEFDEAMRNMYQMIYELGTEKTKQMLKEQQTQA